MDVQPLLDSIRARIDDPERQEILVQMGVDLVEAQAMRMTDPELADSMTRHIKAQALALTATEQKVISDEFMAWVTETTRALLVAAISAV